MQQLDQISQVIQSNEELKKYEKNFKIIKEMIISDQKNNTFVNNVEYLDIKSLFNCLCETLFEKQVSQKFYFSGQYQNLSNDLGDLSMPYEMRSLNAVLTKVQKIKKNSLSEHDLKVIAIIENIGQQLSPAQDVLDWAKESNQNYKKLLKEKKEIRESEKQEVSQIREGFLNMNLSQGEITMFLKQDLLDKLSEMKIKNFDANDYIKKITSHKEVVKTFNFLKDKMKDVHTQIKDSEKKSIQQVLALYQKESIEKKMTDPSDFMHPIHVMALRDLVVYEGRDTNKLKMYSIVKNAEEVIEQSAEKHATEMVNRYISKTVSKVAYCLSQRDDLIDCQILQMKINHFIEGLMEFKFQDGSSFQLNSGIVLSYSKYNKPFYKYPSLFQHVFLSVEDNLIKLAEPSEEKMDKVFINKHLTHEQFQQFFPVTEKAKIKP